MFAVSAGVSSRSSRTLRHGVIGALTHSRGSGLRAPST